MIDAGQKAAEQPMVAAVQILIGAIEQLSEKKPGVSSQDKAMLNFVAQTAWSPRSNRASHLTPLRAAGFSELEIHDITHVACCFSYMNRLADGLGVTTPSQNQEWAEKLFGIGSYKQHLQWANGHPPSTK